MADELNPSYRDLPKHGKTMNAELAELNARIQAAVKKTMEKDAVSEKEAFARHMKYLMAEAPKTAMAYMAWLCK